MRFSLKQSNYVCVVITLTSSIVCIFDKPRLILNKSVENDEILPKTYAGVTLVLDFR